MANGRWILGGVLASVGLVGASAYGLSRCEGEDGGERIAAQATRYADATQTAARPTDTPRTTPTPFPTARPELSPSPIATLSPTPTRVGSPTALPSISPSPTRGSESPSPTSSGTPAPTRIPPITTAENYAVRLNGPTTWVEVADAADLRGLEEFTILARVMVEGDGPHALVAKGDSLEAYGLFISLPVACKSGDMALVVNSKALCSGLKAPTNLWMPVIVTYNREGKVRFFAADGQSTELMHGEEVPIEFGPLTIGLSGFGAKEGMKGKIDALGIMNRALTLEEVRRAQAVIAGSGDVSTISGIASNLIVALAFERTNPFADVTGNGHNGTPKGPVVLERAGN